jgi:phosphotransacetylase
MRRLATIEDAGAAATFPSSIVCPEDRNSLGGALMSANRRLIEPILLGDPGRIDAAAKELGADISAYEIVAVSDPHAPAAHAVGMVNEGKASAVMKGAIHSDALLAEVIKKQGGLRTHVRISHVFAMDVPTIDDLLFISDAAINIAPDLITKVDIVQNAVDLAHACGIREPRVGILSAVETINPNIPSTLDRRCCQRWRSAARSAALWSTGPWRWTTRSTLRRCAPKVSPRWSPGARQRANRSQSGGGEHSRKTALLRRAGGSGGTGAWGQGASDVDEPSR